MKLRIFCHAQRAKREPGHLYILGILFLLSCVSKKEETHELDLKPIEAPPVVSPKQEVKEEKTIEYWKNFFKPYPNISDKKNLLEKFTVLEKSTNVEEMKKAAQTAVALNDLNRGESLYIKCLELSSQDISLYLGLTNIYLRKNKIEHALDLLSTAKKVIEKKEKRDPKDEVQYRYLLAVTIAKSGDIEGSRKILSEIISKEINFSPAYVALANSYLKEDKTNIAEFIVKQGVDRVKENAPLVNIMGMIEQKKNNFLAAQQWFDRALTLDPNFTLALVNKGNIFLDRGDYKSAEPLYEKALAIDPYDVNAYVGLGILKRRQGEYEAAKISLSRAVELDPFNKMARYNLAIVYADHLKKPQDAIRLFHEVIQLTDKKDEMNKISQSYLKELNYKL